MTAGPALSTGIGTGTGASATDAPAAGPARGGAGSGRHTGPRPRRTLRGSARLSLSNWPVSARVIAVFAVASVTGLVFGGLRITDAVGTSNSYSRTVQLAVLGKQVTLLQQDVESERDLTVGVQAFTELQHHATEDHAGATVTVSLQKALGAEEAQLADAQRATSSAAAPVQQIAQGVISNSAFPVSIQNGANNVVAQIGDLDAIRVQVLGQTPAQIIQDYSGTLTDLFALNDQLSSSSGDATLANEVIALGALSRAKDQAAQQRAIIYSGFIESGLNDAGGKVTTSNASGQAFNNLNGSAALTDAGGLQALTTAQFLQLTDLQTFQVSAAPAVFESYLATVAGPKVQTAQTVNNMVTAAPNSNPQAIFPQITVLSKGFVPATAPALWYADQSAVVDAMRTVENQLVAQIVARSQLLQHQAFESALVTSVATAAAVLLVFLATALVGRTLVNPLRRLQEDALEIAAVRLPARVAAAAAGTETVEGSVVEPIGISSTDEIGRVARAFDQVHGEAVRLAGTEAQLRGSLNAMFISLSRRSVPLIERLARLIDSMEQNEDDPDQLANLFSMDHMVTRMRRNSENLLVLAGEEPVRKWTDSVPLTDVARAAASEIEQYSRVALAVQPGIMVSGQAAADVVHLLAELIENATLFSPQSSQVRVTVMELSSGGVLVEVRDDGVGVSPSRLADMNWRLDHPPVVDVSISRHMGLYAVSRLAARHGIRVKLRPGAPQGLSALVWLPGNLARQEQMSTSGGHTRPLSGDRTGLPTGTGPTTSDRSGTGRHRSGLLAPSGNRALLTGQGASPARATTGPSPRATTGPGGRATTGPAGRPTAAQSGRPSTAWFAAKRPSSGTSSSPEESATAWQPATQPYSTTQSYSATQGSSALQGSAAASGTAAQEPAVRTASGLPKRVPKTSAYPGSDTPGSGMPVAASTAASGSSADTGAPVLGAPPFGMAPQGVSHQEAPYQEARQSGQMPSRRRSPEAARSRLAGFQLGSRDAVETGHTAGLTPLAGEENGR